MARRPDTFSNGTEWMIFLESWCYDGCIHHNDPAEDKPFRCHLRNILECEQISSPLTDRQYAYLDRMLERSTCPPRCLKYRTEPYPVRGRKRHSENQLELVL